MKDSLALQLVMGAGALQNNISTLLVNKLKHSGYDTINVSRLAFLSQLECGTNHASDVAKKLGVSRQMVAKTVKDLCQLGYLLQHKAMGKQKTIEFTEKGEALISSCRNQLSLIDDTLLKLRGKEEWVAVIELLAIELLPIELLPIELLPIELLD